MRILITSRTIIVASPLGLASLAHVRSVKCLAPAVLGLVFGRGLAVVIGQNTAASQSQVLAGSSVLRLRGNPA